MKFRDVLDSLENGYRVFRLTWAKGRCLDYHKGSVEAFEGDQLIDEWSPRAEELFADDWVIGEPGRAIRNLNHREQQEAQFKQEHSGGHS